MADIDVVRIIQTDGLNGTNPSHRTESNNMVQNVFPERQAEKEITINKDNYLVKETWKGNTNYVNALLCQFIPNLHTHNFRPNESYVISRGKGDLATLTRTYSEFCATASQSGNPIADNTGVAPWTVTSETTDIGPVEYYILQNNLSGDLPKCIDRMVLAAWDATDLEHKALYQVRTLEGYKEIGSAPANPECSQNMYIGTELTRKVAEFIVESGRNTFPLTTARIIHNKLKNGEARQKALSAAEPLDLTSDAEKDITNSDIEFPNYFGQRLESIPELPEKYNNFGLAENHYFFLDRWNIVNYDGKSRYLTSYEYLAYPKSFPKPWPSVNQPE